MNMHVLDVLLLKHITAQPHEDPEHRDYVPTKMPACHEKKVSRRTQEQAERRQQRLLKRRTVAEKMEEEKQSAQEEEEQLRLACAHSVVNFSQQEHVRDVGSQTHFQSTNHQQTQTSQSTTHQQQQTTSVGVRDFSQQTDAEAKQRSPFFRATIIQGDDSLTRQYTGLPSWGVFLHTVMFLTPFANQAQSIALTCWPCSVMT